MCVCYKLQAHLIFPKICQLQNENQQPPLQGIIVKKNRMTIYSIRYLNNTSTFENIT